jgi:hypothetical protein
VAWATPTVHSPGWGDFHAERQAEHLFQTLPHRAFQGKLELEDSTADLTEEQARYTNTLGIEYALTAPAKLFAEETAQLALPME